MAERAARPGRVGGRHWEPLFAYGTLQFPEVLGALLGRVPAASQASAPGWRAARLRGLSYPGLVPGAGPAYGVLLTGLSPGEWRVIDAYEDAEYDLAPVELADGVAALAYRYTRVDLVLALDWSADDFVTRHLPAFARQCRYWRMTQSL